MCVCVCVCVPSSFLADTQTLAHTTWHMVISWKWLVMWVILCIMEKLMKLCGSYFV